MKHFTLEGQPSQWSAACDAPVLTCKSKGSVPGAWILTVKPVSWITITSCSLDSSPPSVSLFPSCFDSASSVCPWAPSPFTMAVSALCPAMEETQRSSVSFVDNKIYAENYTLKSLTNYHMCCGRTALFSATLQLPLVTNLIMRERHLQTGSHAKRVILTTKTPDCLLPHENTETLPGSQVTNKAHRLRGWMTLPLTSWNIYEWVNRADKAQLGRDGAVVV